MRECLDELHLEQHWCAPGHHSKYMRRDSYINTLLFTQDDEIVLLCAIPKSSQVLPCSVHPKNSPVLILNWNHEPPWEEPRERRSGNHFKITAALTLQKKRDLLHALKAELFLANLEAQAASDSIIPDPQFDQDMKQTGGA
jgi:hypothetical protein